MGILALPPSGIITDNDGIVIGRSSDGKGYLLTGGTEGQVPVIQGDGTIAYGAAGASSLSELDDWAANTLTVPGALTVRQTGGVAGTDEVQIYHDGTNGNIVSQSGNLYLSPSGSSGPRITALNEFANGATGQTLFGAGAASNRNDGITVFGENSTANSQDGQTVIGKGNTASGNRSVTVGVELTNAYRSIVIGSYVSSTANNQLVIARNDGAYSISEVYIGGGVTDSLPIDTTYHATGGSGTDISGANLILAGGKPTGAGTPGQVQFQVAPAGASGTTLGALATVGYFDHEKLVVNKMRATDGTNVNRYIDVYQSGGGGYLNFATLNGTVLIQRDGTPFLTVDGFTINILKDIKIDADTGSIVGQNNNAPGSWESPAGSDVRIQAGFGSSGNGGGILQIRSGNAKGTDIAGSPIIVAGGPGTGAGNGGDFVIKHALAGVSGYTVNTTWVDVVKVDSQGLTVLQPGGVAGTDEIQIYHDGTNAHVDAQSGDLIFNNSTAMVNSSGEFTNNAGYTETEVFGAGITNVGIRNVVVGALARADDRNNVLVGYNTYGAAKSNTCVGSSARSSGFYAVLLGAGVTSTSGYNINIGYNSSNSVFGTCLIGSSEIKDFYWGDGITDTVPQDATLHATGGSGTDISGANLILAGGKGTGTGVGGSVIVQAAPVGLTGTSLNSLVDVAEFDADTTAGNTRFLIYDVDNGQLERVSVGAADSGGAGYKLLRIAN